METTSELTKVLEAWMWENLKTTKAVELFDWDETDEYLRNFSEKWTKFCSYIKANIEINPETFFWTFDHWVNYYGQEHFPPVQDALWMKGATSKEVSFYNFIKRKQKDWPLHKKIAREALNVFLFSEVLSEARAKFVGYLCLVAIKERRLCPYSLPDIYQEQLPEDLNYWYKSLIEEMAARTAHIFVGVDWMKTIKGEMVNSHFCKNETKNS